MNNEIVGGSSAISMDVTRREMAKTFALAYSSQHFATYKDQRAFTFDTAQTPTGPGDYFLYIQNTSATRDMIITSVRANGGTADTINLQPVTGTPAGGTDLNPINRAPHPGRAGSRTWTAG